MEGKFAEKLCSPGAHYQPPRHGAPARLPAAPGTPLGIQSHHQSNGQALPLAGLPFQEPTSSNGLHANGDPQAAPNNYPRPEPVVNAPNSGHSIPAPTPNGLDLGQGNIECVLHSNFMQSFSQDRYSVPEWITFVKPIPPAGENVVTFRRDVHLALDIILERLPRTVPAGYTGIKVPATASVRNSADTTGKTLLEFRIRLYGATTKQRYDVVCASCQKREGKRRGIPGLIDFKTESDMIEPKNGKIRVEFVFCCYPKDHRLGDTGYL